jgi:hypothetical protein
MTLARLAAVTLADASSLVVSAANTRKARTSQCVRRVHMQLYDTRSDKSTTVRKMGFSNRHIDRHNHRRIYRCDHQAWALLSLHQLKPKNNNKQTNKQTNI